MRKLKWTTMLLALGMLSGTAFGAHPQEASPYITAGPVVQGIPQLPENWAILSYNGFVFDTRVGEPALPAGLRIESYPKGMTGYYLVTVRVPVTEAVKGELTAAGMKIINFMPNNSFLVSMDEAAKARVQASPAVSWVGIHQPAYKIASWFQGLSGTQNVWVQLFQDADIQAAVRAIRLLGVSSVSIEDQDMYKTLKVQMDVALLPQLARMREVSWLEPWPVYYPVNADAQWVTQTFSPGVRQVWNKGILGVGQTVHTSDTGVRTTHNFFRDPAVPITGTGQFPTHRKMIAYIVVTGAAFGDVAAGSYHGTHTGGTICGDDSYVGGTDPNVGMSKKAKFWFTDIGDGSGGLVVPANIMTGIFVPSYTGNAGGAARVSSNSWGNATNTYSQNSAYVDQMMWTYKDYLIVYSNGNSGPGGSTVGNPATAKNCVSAGAGGDGFAATTLAGFSSRGPANDTRRKPTVVAPGVGLMSSYGLNDNGLRQMSGTSMSSPCIASNAALVRDYFARGFYPTGDSVVGNRWPYISAAIVKAVLVNGAANDVQGYTIPDNNIGWGRINLDNTLFFAGDGRKLAAYDDTTGLSTGQNRSYNVDVNTNAEPLKITMVYTDYYAVSGANPAIVNNLNLTVTSPGGAQTYLGNVFSGGWSQTGGAADARNMEECVYIQQPTLGTWTVRVDAPSVPSGTRQAFAVVVSGGLGTLGAQVLSLRKNVIIDNFTGSNGNNNGRVDIGETAGFVDTLYNGGAAAVNSVVATLRCADPQVMFNRGDTIANYGNMAVGATAHNGATPFKFVVRGNPRIVTFTLHLYGVLVNDMPYTNDIQIPVRVGLAYGEAISVITPPVRTDSSMIYGLAYDGTNLWAAEWVGGRIYRLNPSNGNVLGNIPGPTATMLTDLCWDWGDNTLWSTSQSVHNVYKLNPANGNILRQFASRATAYSIGLETRGWGPNADSTLWEGDRGVAITDPKNVYKCDTSGNLIQQFTGGQLPAWFTVPAGPRCIAFEPQGQPYWNGGTLLWVVTDFGAPPNNDLAAAHVYEVKTTGNNLDTAAVANHHFICGWNLRAIERDTTDWNYWVSAFVTAGLSNIYKIRGFYTKPSPPSGAELGPVALPTSFALGQSYPNPMVGGATIKYALPRDVPVSLKVYNVSGQLVKTLVSGTEKAGYKQVSWDGKSNGGHKVGAGVYFYRFQAGDFTATKKLVVVR
jgi:hypothetical protein